MLPLPIDEILPSIRQTLHACANAILTAAPGAGKTTRVPLALLGESWLSDRKILLLEPRRLAARAAASRMAEELNERVGETVGYRMRLETKVGPTTRIEVVTEGILTRMLHQDPSLEAYGIVLFDEFHERSLQADMGLTLCLETQRLFRPDLRLLVMSATLDCGPVSDLLGQAPIITCQGRMFPVETRYLDQSMTSPLDHTVTQAIKRALARDQGSLLVFLPGLATIRRVERMLLDAELGASIHIAPLHGELSQAMQDAAIRPVPLGSRKVVLATSIAETSVTIDGIRVVIDSGWLRLPRFDPRSGLTRLETIRVTKDSADQRRGRAGRLEPGVCYRLWTEKEQTGLAAHRPPEMLEADLAPLMLDLAQWGTQNPEELSWLTPPPHGGINQSKELLTRLGAFSTEGRLTEHGRHMATLPVHPRLSHMLIQSKPLGFADLACELAALLSERDIFHGPRDHQNPDLRIRVDLLHGEYDSVGLAPNQATVERVKRTAHLWRRQLGERCDARSADGHDPSQTVGVLLALAYPDRIAQRQPGEDARYRLVNGRGARFIGPNPMDGEPFLVIADLDGGTPWARINLAAPIAREDIESLYRDQLVVEESVTWDETAGAVRASRRHQLGSVVTRDEVIPQPHEDHVMEALLHGIRQAGFACLPFTRELQEWRARVTWVRQATDTQSNWPDLSNETLLRTLDTWLSSYLTGITSLHRVKRLDLTPALHALLTYEQQRRLDQLAPPHIVVPSGSRLRIDYEQGDIPVLAVRLQEMFGCQETPRVASGKIPVMLHLLSPAGRPVQVTQDLAGFWTRAYHDVRKELRGRYPKHHWPEDPLHSAPTARPKRRR